MKTILATFVLLTCSLCPATAQTQMDAATKEDVEQMLQLTGTRERMQVTFAAMAQQVGSSAADTYKRNHPDASPEKVQHAAEAAGERAQQAFKALPADELVDAMVPIYQRYLTHSDVRAINEFYASPTGQKLLKDSTPMMLEAMKAAQAIVQKHMPEIEEQAEKAAQEANKSSEAPPK